MYIPSQMQNGGNLFCVGHPQYDGHVRHIPRPHLGLLGDFASFDAGTALIESRNMVATPPRYRCHLIAASLTLPKAWEVVGHEITTPRGEIACSPLLNFLHLGCTQNAAPNTASVLARNADGAALQCSPSRAPHRTHCALITGPKLHSKASPWTTSSPEFGPARCQTRGSAAGPC
jgi:hypothetical protein